MTRSTLKGMMTAAALFAVSACGDAGSPMEPVSAFAPAAPVAARAPSGQMSFSSSTTYDYYAQTPQSASGGTGQVSFAGSITTGTPCFNITAAHATGSGTLTITVSAAPNGNACIQVITHHNYNGTVSGLAAGTYAVTVVHDYGNRSSETAYTGTVVVS